MGAKTATPGLQPVLNPVPDRFSAPHSTSQIPPVFTALKLNFNFGAAPIDAPPSVVLLALKNSGMVPLDWYGVGCWGTGAGGVLLLVVALAA